jgi:hypothetical protein
MRATIVCPCPWHVPRDRSTKGRAMLAKLAGMHDSGMTVDHVGFWTGRPGNVATNGIAIIGRPSGPCIKLSGFFVNFKM